MIRVRLMSKGPNLQKTILSSSSGTKWYSGSWPIRVTILRILRDHGPRCPTEELKSRLSIPKSLLSFHLKALKREGFVEKGPSSGFATWSVTQAGSKFLDGVSKYPPRGRLVTLENSRFRYPILKDASTEVDW